MNIKRLFAGLLTLIGIAGILTVTGWYYYQVREAALTSDRRWVKRVSDQFGAERQALTRWIQHFPVKSATFRDIAHSRADVVGMVLIDQQRLSKTPWIHPKLKEKFEPLDPRLSVLQLQALAKQQTLTGPIVFVKHKPYFTVVRPLDKNRVLIAFLDASRLWNLLKEDADVWQLRVAVYDFERNPLFSSADALPPEILNQALHGAQSKDPLGMVLTPDRSSWNWLITYHYDPASDWIFIIIQPAVLAYAPLLSFLVALLGVVLLAYLPKTAKMASD